MFCSLSLRFWKLCKTFNFSVYAIQKNCKHICISCSHVHICVSCSHVHSSTHFYNTSSNNKFWEHKFVCVSKNKRKVDLTYCSKTKSLFGFSTYALINIQSLVFNLITKCRVEQTCTEWQLQSTFTQGGDTEMKEFTETTCSAFVLIFVEWRNTTAKWDFVLLVAFFISQKMFISTTRQKLNF